MNAFLAFDGHDCRAAGALETVADFLREHPTTGDGRPWLIFEPSSGRQIDLDLRRTNAELAAEFSSEDGDVPVRTGRRGRPKLGVVGREVTLLPRHWAWLERQRGGASAALRRLVDEARSAGGRRDGRRAAQDRTNRFLGAIAGDLAGFEEAIRALYGGDRARFDAETAAWPPDIRHYATALAAGAWPESC
ncbi:MAG: DUF2239 family protein [Pseudomonadota bacterium]